MSQDDRERSRAALKRVREETLAVLELRHASQRLDRDDYERMLSAARHARNTEELQSLLREGPANPSPVAVPVPSPATRAATALVAPDLALDSTDEQGFVFAVMSSASRKGHWEPPARLYVTAVMGSIGLDFRGADLLEGVSEVIVCSVMGGVNIIVPPDVDVEVNGVGLLGAFAHLSRRTDDDDTPLLRVKGLALMGGVNVKVKK